MNGAPVTVCHLTSVHRPFDTRVFHRECRTLAAAGYRVVLVCGNAAPEQAGERDGVLVTAVPRPRGRWQRMLATTWRVVRAARRTGAHLYHFHDPELLPAAALLLRATGRPVIYDVHEDYPRQILGKPYLPRPVRRPLAAVVGVVEKLLARSLSALVTAGDDVTERFAGLARRGTPVVTLGNYPEAEPHLAAAPARPPRTDGGLRLVNFGGVWSARVTAEQVAALARLPQERDIRLVLGGRVMEPPLFPRLQAMPGWRRVEYLDQVPREVMIERQLAADAAVVLYADHPNHHGIRSNRLYESLLAGLPVLVSDFPRWRAFVEEHRCGLAVDPHDPDAIAAAMLWLADHPEETRAMGQRGRRAVLARYTWDHEADKLLDLYRRLLGAAGEGTR